MAWSLSPREGWLGHAQALPGTTGWSSRAACLTEVEQVPWEDDQEPVLCMVVGTETLPVQVVLSGSSTLPSGGHYEPAPAPGYV